jgi:hypothetical protein
MITCRCGMKFKTQGWADQHAAKKGHTLKVKAARVDVVDAAEPEEEESSSITGIIEDLHLECDAVTEQVSSLRAKLLLLEKRIG